MIKSFFSSYWKSILVTAGILYLSFSSPSTFKSIPTFSIPHIDKGIHVIMYFALTLTLIWDFEKKNNDKERMKKRAFACILFPILLGGVIEILQEMFFKPRSADWFDWFADILGVALAWLIMLFFFKRKTKTG